MPWSTRFYCSVQQICVILLIMGPFGYVSMQWLSAHGPIPTAGSLWDIGCFTLMFFGLLMLLDNVCTWSNEEFKQGY